MASSRSEENRARAGAQAAAQMPSGRYRQFSID
jgi:hypothetical protein